jgi:hypothetical protein
MTFFNKKEDVLEIKLTRIGREKLSTGDFKPTHYEFLDEDILYDRQYQKSGSVEQQNEIKDRIKNKLIIKEPTARQGVTPYNKKPLLENKRMESLGTFAPYSSYKPAWQIIAQDGTLFTGSGDISYSPIEVIKGGSIGPSYEKIPQLDLVCTYNYNQFTFNQADTTTEYYADVQENQFIDFSDLFKKPEDDSFILFEKNFNDFTISVEEENTLLEKEKFTLEVFKYEYSNDYATASLNRLFFDEEDISPTSVGWYFNISVDAEINTEGFSFVDEEVVIEKVDDECVDL